MGNRSGATVRRWATALLVAGMGLASSASATLIDQGGGLIYDSDFNITWLADANYAQTQYTASGGTLGDADGAMVWPVANAWAANLVYHDSVRNVDYSDWRLPTALNQDLSGPCVGYNCTGSEMGHLFYTEGGLSAGSSMLTSPILNGKFTNMQSYAYWSGTVYAPDPAYDGAWYFDVYSGYQSYGIQPNEFYAWAVRPGDVAAAVPEPETYAMLLAGLGLLGVVAKRRRRSFGAS